MKAVRYHTTGGPEVLQLEDVPTPAAAPGQALIRIEAAGVNYADVVRRSGGYYPVPTPLPHIVGAEVVGVVVGVGDGVPKSMIGTRVIGAPNGGGYAEYVTLPAAMAFAFPPDIEPAVGVALFIQGLTAAFALKEAGRLLVGETVFIEGAAGGVGSLAVQLAKYYGAARVIAGAGSESRRAAVIALGADLAVDYTQRGWAKSVMDLTGGHGADVLLEMSGGEVFEESMDAMAPLGRIVAYGFASGKIVPVMLPRLVARSLTLATFGLPFYLRQHGLAQARLDELGGLVRGGKLRIQIGGIFSLAQAADAHRALQSRQVVGKLVIVPG